MQKQADINYQNETFYISGDLDFGNIAGIYKKSKRFLAEAKALTFDFSSLSSSNSAGLALMIEWVKYASHHQQSIRFINIPSHLHAIVEMAGLSKLVLS